MSKSADSGIAQQQAEQIFRTNAMGLIADMTHFFKRDEFHATVSGFRVTVGYEGQMYEVLVNPLYKLAKEADSAESN